MVLKVAAEAQKMCQKHKNLLARYSDVAGDVDGGGDYHWFDCG